MVPLAEVVSQGVCSLMGGAPNLADEIAKTVAPRLGRRSPTTLSQSKACPVDGKGAAGTLVGIAHGLGASAALFRVRPASFLTETRKCPIPRAVPFPGHWPG